MRNLLDAPVLPRILALLGAAALAGCATPPDPLPASTEIAPLAAECPQGLPDGARCLRGTDSAGSHYLIAIPAVWNRTLVLHAHGGPLLGAPSA